MTNTTAVQIMTDDITDDTLTKMRRMITRTDGLEANSSGRSLSVGSAYTQQTDYVPSCSTFANNRLAITTTIIIIIIIIIILFFLVPGSRTVGSTRMLVKSVSSSRRRDVARSAMPASSLSRGDHFIRVILIIVIIVIVIVLIVKRW